MGPAQGDLLDYYDIMVIGKTGAGKSTTVDKLLIARLPGKEHIQQEQADTGSEAGITHDPHNRALRHENMTMWLISDKDFDLDRVSMRLKNMVFFRSLENPHTEINSIRESGMHIYESTRNCELFSNELTRLQVLDVPGFFGHEAAGQATVKDLSSHVVAVKEFDLLTMRKILRIKSTHNFKFNRIVYFLPVKGSLKRTSQDLIIELGVMKEYFGRPIFESMVVVATYPSDTYEYLEDDGRNLFPESKVQNTRRHLREALQDVFKCDDVPDPPIIFISLFDSCEEILRKVQTAPVKQDMLNLKFSSSICSRCDVKIIDEGAGKGQSSCCSFSDQYGAIALDESTCHPMMVPKYSTIMKFFGGVAHLITFRQFVGRWPSFENLDEECISCKQPPKSHGCMKVGSKVMFGKESLTVQHSTSAMDQYQITVVEDEADSEKLRDQIDSSSQTCDSDGAAECERQGNYHVYGDGRQVYKQPGVKLP